MSLLTRALHIHTYIFSSNLNMYTQRCEHGGPVHSVQIMALTSAERLRADSCAELFSLETAKASR